MDLIHFFDSNLCTHILWYLLVTLYYCYYFVYELSLSFCGGHILAPLFAYSSFHITYAIYICITVDTVDSVSLEPL